MIPTCFAWGSPSVFDLKNGTTIYGCQFEVLPGATMLNRPCTLLGVIGIPAAADPHGAEPVWRTIPGATLSIYAIAQTEPCQLEPFQAEIIDSYRQHMNRLGVAAGF